MTGRRVLLPVLQFQGMSLISQCRRDVCNAFATPEVQLVVAFFWLANHLVGHMREIDFETQERQDEILALLRMMRYASRVAGELDAFDADCHIRAAQAALISTLATEFPMLSREHLGDLINDTQGHC